MNECKPDNECPVCAAALGWVNNYGRWTKYCFYIASVRLESTTSFVRHTAQYFALRSFEASRNEAFCAARYGANDDQRISWAWMFWLPYSPLLLARFRAYSGCRRNRNRNRQIARTSIPAKSLITCPENGSIGSDFSMLSCLETSQGSDE